MTVIKPIINRTSVSVEPIFPIASYTMNATSEYILFSVGCGITSIQVVYILKL